MSTCQILYITLKDEGHFNQFNMVFNKFFDVIDIVM